MAKKDSMENVVVKKKPWDRLKDESTKHYAWFQIYLSLGFDRSVRKTHEEMSSNSVSEQYLEKVCTKNKWVSRAEAYDDELLKRSMASAMKTQEKHMASKIKNKIVISSKIDRLQLDICDDENMNNKDKGIAIKTLTDADKNNTFILNGYAGIPNEFVEQNVKQEINTKLETSIFDKISAVDKELARIDEIEKQKEKELDDSIEREVD